MQKRPQIPDSGRLRSFGTEDRPTPRPVPARDEVYEYIIFKASDIKDLIVCEAPKPPPQQYGLAYDPAIISVTQQPAQQSQAQSQPVATHIKQEPPSGTSSPSTSPPIAGVYTPSAAIGSGRHDFRPTQTYGQTQPPPNRYPKPAQPAQQAQQQLTGGFAQSVSMQSRQNQQQPKHHETGHDVKQEDNRPLRNAQQAQSQHQNYQPQQYNTQGRGQAPRGRGGHLVGGPPRDKLKFDSDYDFETANEKFQQQLADVTTGLSKASVDGGEKENPGYASAELVPESDTSSQTGDTNGDPKAFYNKSTSFFDSISCEALEKEEGRNTRPNWRKERLTNQETFGHSAVRSLNYRRGSRGGYRGYSGQQQQGYQQQRYGSGGGYGGGRGYQQPQRYNHNQGNRSRNYQHPGQQAAEL
ncbi:FDF domain-containing protein [Ditylenchus destructor]|uniref:FDF domain-containing protein n=1 Tax=Ditylenchus destructor TaxID=166010 RepID=A0AAD4R2K0_9BILA|nr:FDF domain-containing protein [Ditylenchus destructor]